jgi:poly-gamma-glutamate synthesis protein (capsule biosynthesis protein)
MKHSIVLGAVGDIMLARATAAQMKMHGFAWPMAEMRPVLSKADVLFGNMESVILPPDYPQQQVDRRGLVTHFDGSAALREAGFHFLNLASNHILDGGTVGMFHTRQAIESQGILTGGIGENQAEARRMRTIEKNGLRIGFLCYAEDCNYTLGTRGPCHAYYSRENVLEDIERNKKDVDVLVVSLHADLEFMETPSIPRRDNSREFARAGATLILEHHPHVPQGVERIGNSLIAYSLGDFCFPVYSDSYLRAHLPNTARSYVLLAEVGKNGVEEFSREPLEILQPPNERPAPATGAARAEILQYLDTLDQKVQDDEVLARTWREVSLETLDSLLLSLAAARDPQVARRLLGRVLLVAGNRSWFDEACRAIADDWSALVENEDAYHRPNYRFIEWDIPRRFATGRRVFDAMLRRLKRLARL